MAEADNPLEGCHDNMRDRQAKFTHSCTIRAQSETSKSPRLLTVVAGNERFRERSKITLKAGNQALDTVTNTDAPARRAEMRVGKATPMLERQEMAVMMMMMMNAYGIMGIVSGEVVFSYALASRGFSIPRPDWPRRNPSTPIFLRNSREFFREFLRS